MVDERKAEKNFDGCSISLLLHTLTDLNT